ncbi:NOD26-like intrinsic protein 1;2, NOD26-LIKE INTRINSIC PROTEIN 2 [Hibiscus trionum]|uniref:NOD26-like intrinsic protein 12, NOD26-LIKE INTRINSIC PROTEIN 2 n=1 Tax=Hibiscus trionum TaxID=183268 RepID=A0A9W7MQL9_HIBTR|nr:NOD26-like intrinsic protein 1;2, NOD26-LIKE INTRINSIC PROTEIN 2 [Hibiscus trionum]
MAEISKSRSNGNHVVLNVNGDANDHSHPSSSPETKESHICFSVPFMQKLLTEVLGTYFLIFTGCAAVVVNANNHGVVSHPGIAAVWGLTVIVLFYSSAHVSGAHFNPAITIAFATCKRFPLKQVPVYILAQVVGSTLAAGTLRLLFSGPHDVFAGTSPQGSDLQAFLIEFIITFYLMFIISGAATDNRAIGELAGLAIGSTVLLNVLIAGPITGASMNPARSLGPAIVSNHYKGIWIYLTSPVVGAVSGAWVYNMVRDTDKPLLEIIKSASFLRSSRKCC